MIRARMVVRIALQMLAAAPFPALAARSPDDVRSDLLTPIGVRRISDPRKVALGERLFRDPRLPSDGRGSGLSCHDLASNGATAVRVNKVLAAASPFNTPTIFNATRSFRQNREGDVATVDTEIAQTLFDRRRLGVPPRQIVARLARAPAIVGAFRATFHQPVDAAGLLDAISRYVDALQTPDARFDRWLKGDRSAMTARELRGYKRFRPLAVHIATRV